MKVSNMMFKFVSLVVWFGIALITILIVSSILIISPVYLIDRKRRAGHWLASRWGRTIVFLNPFWKVSVIGRENFDTKKAYVIVSNHQSMGDIIALYFLDTHFKWLAKDSLFSVPVLGWGMSAVGYVRVSRGKQGSIRDSIQGAIDWLRRDVSVLFFPEGTRSMTGEIGTFKNGAFKLALQCNVPILPVVIAGTRDVIPKGSWVFRQKVNALISILPPIFPRADEDFSNLKERASALMTAELMRLKNPALAPFAHLSSADGSKLVQEDVP